MHFLDTPSYFWEMKETTVSFWYSFTFLSTTQVAFICFIWGLEILLEQVVGLFLWKVANFREWFEEEISAFGFDYLELVWKKKNIYLSKYIHQQLNIKMSCSLTAYFIVLLNRKVPRFLPFMYKVLTVLILRSHARIQCFPELIRSSWEDQVIVYPTISTVLSQDKDLNFLLLTSCLFQVLIYPTRSSKPMNFYRWQVFLQIRTCSST